MREFRRLEYRALILAHQAGLPLKDWQTRSAALFLYYPSRRQVPVPLQAFIEFLRENLRAR